MAAILNVVVGTAGHIDHGKSLLVRRLTGIDPDRLPEEKERGLTIDLGFAPWVMPDGRKVGFIDVPGHEKFLKNMIAGATSLDAVVLVVAADDGVMPQTREHVDVLTILGIRRGIVALTKTDLATPERVLSVKEDIEILLLGTSLEGARVFPVNSHSGEGYPALEEGLASLLRDLPPRSDSGVFRMPVQRVFSIRGFGTVVTGVPLAGSARIGDVLEIVPSGKRSRVRALQAYGGRVEDVHAGHSSALNLPDIGPDDVRRGHVVAEPGFLRAATFLHGRFRFTCRDRGLLRHQAAIRIHAGTAEVMGAVNLLEGRDLRPGESALVQVRLDEPLAAAPGDPFVLRLQAPPVVLGGGEILLMSPIRPAGNRRSVVDHLLSREAALRDGPASVDLLLRLRGPGGASVLELAREACLPVDIVRDVLAGLRSRGAVLPAGNDRAVHQEGMRQAETSVVTVLETFHRADPRLKGADRLRVGVDAGLGGFAVDAALEALARRGVVVLEGPLVRMASHIPTAPTDDPGLVAVRAVLLRGRFSPPTLPEIAEAAGLPRAEAARHLRVLVQHGEAVLLSSEIAMHRDVVAEGEAAIRQLGERGPISPAAVRDALGTSRRYVLPLLAHTDAKGITVREGDHRSLARRPPDRGGGA